MTESVSYNIAMILAYARSGALDRAWQMFDDMGLAARRDDPAVLTLQARLLKDRARRTMGEERRRGYLAAAQVYRAAAELQPATYPLINAATLLRLAGKTAEAASLADDILALLDRDSDIGGTETPYYLEATRAEALLLRGDVAAAEESLERAQALAPRAWEDHATTLRQFALILSEAGEPMAWLDRFRPPRAVHFAGSMRLPADDPALVSAIDRWIGEERVGFAFGALAAGADIIIAEAMVRAGAELHILLPAPREAFVAESVRPFGSGWEERFDALMALAESVRELDEGVAATHPASITLADSVVMGMTVLQARQFETEAVQLVVSARNRTGPHTQFVRKSWAEAGRRQHHLVIDWPQDISDSRGEPGGYRLISMLAIAFDRDRAAPRSVADDLLIGRLAALGRALGSHRPLVNLGWFDRTLLLAYAGAADAARGAKAILAAMEPATRPRIAGHIGLLRPIEDPATGRLLMFGHAVDVTLRMLEVVPEGSVLVSDNFAAVLNAGDAPADAEPVGELDGGDSARPVGLWALRL